MKFKVLLPIAWLAIMASCGQTMNDFQRAEDQINEQDLAEHVITLASDEFMGRQPFTPGEEKTVNYLKSVMEEMGLEEANHGSFFQDVPMVEITFHPPKEIELKAPKGKLELKYIDDYIFSTSHVKDEVKIENSELVFAGYGIVAPEFNWNDYEGLDCKGKTVLVIVNDPGFATQNPDLFGGNAMTYYGRWTYKFEEAARQGATGVLVIHNTAGAGYPWQVLTNTAANKLFIQSEDGNLSNCALNGWITDQAATKLFEKCGLDYQEMAAHALEPDFSAISLNTKLDFVMTNDLRYANSKNVLGMVKGTDLSDECIVYTAHWDHFGIGPAMDGDSIYNGFADNGIPVASMLETAKAFTALKQKPRRTVIFLAITAEETGLLGSKYYAENPVIPAQKTAANLNYELFIPMGRMKDVTITGFGQSELDDYVAEAAEAQDRYIMPEPYPEKGMYYRSDHFSFAQVGIPSLFVKGWSDHREKGKEYAKSIVDFYWANTYHKPSDEYNPETTDFSGNVEDAKLFFKIGYKLAMEDKFPKWSDHSEFKAIREKSLNE